MAFSVGVYCHLSCIAHKLPERTVLVSCLTAAPLSQAAKSFSPPRVLLLGGWGDPPPLLQTIVGICIVCGLPRWR